MPTSEGTPGLPANARALDDPRVRRTLRYTVAVTLATAYAYYFNWSFNFIAVLFVANFIMVPIPAPSLRFAIGVLVRLYIWLLIGLGLLLPIQHLPVFGVALVALIVFLFYYAQAQGRFDSLDSSFLLVAVLIVGASGASIDTAIAFTKGFAKGGLLLFPVVWIAFALLPEKLIDRMPNIPAIEGDSVDHALYALRTVLVVIPILLFLLMSNNTMSYIVVAMKGAQVAAQANEQRGRAFVADLLLATIVGSGAGLIIYWLLKLWPSLIWYILLTALGALYFGWQMSRGPNGVNPRWYRWGYAYQTSIVLLGPVLLTDDFTSDDPETRFYLRVLQFFAVTAFASGILHLFDGVREKYLGRRKSLAAS